MKKILLLVLSLILVSRAFCQDTAWSAKKINEFLKVDLPANYTYEEQGIVKSYIGNIEQAYFGVSYYDTAMRVKDAESFKISLTGFAHGISKRVQQDEYNITLKDTSVGNTKGLLIRFEPNAKAAYPQRIVYYVTLANDHFYSFLYSMTADVKTDILQRRFLSMIKFDADKIKESTY